MLTKLKNQKSYKSFVHVFGSEIPDENVLVSPKKLEPTSDIANSKHRGAVSIVRGFGGHKGVTFRLGTSVKVCEHFFLVSRGFDAENTE